MPVTSPAEPAATRSTEPRTVRPPVAVFPAAAFLGAFLLFLVQPMVGKMILPRFGGVPAVWNTCQLFFQFVLLAGYGYAHLSVARLGVRRQAALHLPLLLIPVVSLPVAIPAGWDDPATGNPIPALLALLALAVGLPFFVVSATAPLLQRWYAVSGRPGAADPYFLYAASNLGSLAALVAYPVVIGPSLTLREQGQFWAVGFGVLAVLIATCGLVARSAPVVEPAPQAAGEAAPIPWPLRLRWVALAFVPSSLLLGVTTHITTDLAPIPLLWVVPLGLYLLSFVLVFLKLPRAVRVATAWTMPVSLLCLLGLDIGRGPALGLHLLFFFAAAMVLHGELARLRPPAERLTEFYFWMSVGGVLGGVANAVVAPLLLNGFYEYRAAMVLAGLLMPSPWPPADRRVGWKDVLLPAGLGVAAAVAYFQSGSADSRLATAAACALFVRRPVRFGLGVAALLIAHGAFAASKVEVIHQSRNFFGVLVVTNEPEAKVHRLTHGTTEHGLQQLHTTRSVRRLPRSYYDPTGPIGQVFVGNRSGAYPPVAVVGLGAGALASYAEDGQEFTFFEIDPDVVKVAEDPQYFTYLSESRARLRIVPGDARLTLAREPERHYGIIVIDAFSSDAVPVHLLTAEALDVYLGKLADGGLIAFHVSNNYLDLERVLDGLARAKGLRGLAWADDRLSRDEVRRGKRASQWVLLARDMTAFRWVGGEGWKPLPGSPDSPVWTDDYSNLLAVLRLRK
jgi:hypothetical protein